MKWMMMRMIVVAFIVTCSQFRVNGQMFVEIMSKVQGLHNINGYVTNTIHLFQACF